MQPSRATRARSRVRSGPLAAIAGRTQNASPVLPPARRMAPHKYTPPNSAAAAASSRTSRYVRQRSGRGVRRWGRLAAVVVLVVVAVVARVVILVPIQIDPVQDRADDVRFAALHHFNGALGMRPPGHFRADHEYQT